MTGERAWEFKRGVTQIKDNVSLRGCTLKKKKHNVRSVPLLKEPFPQEEKMKN